MTIVGLSQASRRSSYPVCAARCRAIARDRFVFVPLEGGLDRRFMVCGQGLEMVVGDVARDQLSKTFGVWCVKQEWIATNPDRSWETEHRSQFPNRGVRILRVQTWETGHDHSVSQKAFRGVGWWI
jgi:hypothetical protein